MFVIVKDHKNNFNCYYSRLTPILHKTTIGNDVKKFKNEIRKNFFFEANDNTDFRAIVKKPIKDGGFVRDLFIDSIRCSYQAGSIAYRNPEDFGLNNWPKETIFPDVLAEQGTDYMKNVKSGLSLLERVKLINIRPDFEEETKRLKDEITNKS